MANVCKEILLQFVHGLNCGLYNRRLGWGHWGRNNIRLFDETEIGDGYGGGHWGRNRATKVTFYIT